MKKKKININNNIKDIIKKLQINKKNIFNKNYNLTESKKIIKSQDFSYSKINNLINNNFLKKKIINSFTSRIFINKEKTETSEEKEIKNKSENKLQTINQIKISNEQKQIYENKNKIKLDNNLKNNLTIKQLQTQTKPESNLTKILQLKEERENIILNPYLVNENKIKKNNKNKDCIIEGLKNNNTNIKINEIKDLKNEEKKMI